MKIIWGFINHVAVYFVDLLNPALFRIRLVRGVSSSKEQVLRLIDYLKPVQISKPLERFGPRGDGGYLVPNDFDGVTACFSPGVSDVAGFELDLANKGIPCFLIDASVNCAPVQHEKIFFEPLFLGPTSDGFKFVSLEDWVHEKAPGTSDLVLQIDIEGAEYEALLATPEPLLKRFRLIVMELHDLDFLMTDRYSAIGFEIFLKHIRTVFDVIHIHPNNNRRVIKHHGIQIPPVIEITLLRKDRVIEIGSDGKSSLPNKLDEDNSPRRKAITFSRDWTNPVHNLNV